MSERERERERKTDVVRVDEESPLEQPPCLACICEMLALQHT
jgi:hypothetical protein